MQRAKFNRTVGEALDDWYDAVVCFYDDTFYTLRHIWRQLRGKPKGRGYVGLVEFITDGMSVMLASLPERRWEWITLREVRLIQKRETDYTVTARIVTPARAEELLAEYDAWKARLSQPWLNLPGVAP